MEFRARHAIARAVRAGFRTRNLFLAGLVIFLFGLALRTVLVVETRDYLHPQPYETPRVARSIVESGVFGNPWILPTGPTAEYAPFQPYLISLVYRVFGTGARGELVRYVVGCAASSLTYAVLPYAAGSLGLPVSAGVLAGFAGAALPLKYQTEISGAWEAPWAALILILLTARAARLFGRPAFAIGTAALDGVLWGLAFLISPSLMPVLAGLIVLEGWRWFRAYRVKYSIFLLVRLASVLCVLLPWTLRNYDTFGVLCPVRCSFGLEFFTGNNRGAYLTTTSKPPAGAPQLPLHPTVNPAECARLIQLGEAAYNREKLHAALEWIKEQPGGFVSYTAAHSLLFWFHWTGSITVSAVDWILAGGAIMGFVLLIKMRHPAVPLFANIWITFPLIYYFIQSSTKYRYPMDWTFWLLAAFTGHVVGSKWLKVALPRDSSFERVSR